MCAVDLCVIHMIHRVRTGVFKEGRDRESIIAGDYVLERNCRRGRVKRCRILWRWLVKGGRASIDFARKEEGISKLLSTIDSVLIRKGEVDKANETQKKGVEFGDSPKGRTDAGLEGLCRCQY